MQTLFKTALNKPFIASCVMAKRVCVWGGGGGCGRGGERFVSACVLLLSVWGGIKACEFYIIITILLGAHGRICTVYYYYYYFYAV